MLFKIGGIMNLKKRILILDDEPIVVERFGPTMERAGFDVATCTSSADAIRFLRTESFDILVTDLKMSGADGMDVMKVAQRQHPKIKVVVITGFATQKTYEDAMEMGAVAFIAKPFKLSQLKKLIVSIATGIK